MKNPVPLPENIQAEIVLMGTGTSHGVPMLGCRCPVCKSDHPRNKRTRSGVFVNAAQGNFVIDTSPDLRTQLLREHVDVVHAALFTHSHADHIFGLDDLRLFGHRLNQDIPLYCEESVEQQLRQSFNYAFQPPPENGHLTTVPRFRFERIGLEPFEILGLSVQPIRLLHGRWNVLGFRLGDVAFCTDVSKIPQESWPLLQGCRILILDALRYKPHPTHFSLKQAMDVVEKIRPQHAYFTHISHDLEYETANSQLPENVELAYDGLKLQIGSPFQTNSKLAREV